MPRGRRSRGRARFRTLDQVREVFAGLEMVEPGVVPVPHWRPYLRTPRMRDQPVLKLACAGATRKP